jgi:hypothetical protein
MLIPRNIILWSKYLNDNTNILELSDEIILPSYYLSHILDKYSDDITTYLVNIINTETRQKCVVSIGTPHFDDKSIVFVPQWILDMIGYVSESDVPVRITIIDSNDIPLATKIIIKPLDSMIFNTDPIKCFETALMNLHVLTEGATIPIKIPEFSNYEFLAYVEKVEPESIVRVHSGDLEVEFNREYEEPATQTDTTDIQPTVVENNVAETITENNVAENTIANREELSLEERRRRVRESWLNKTNIS